MHLTFCASDFLCIRLFVHLTLCASDFLCIHLHVNVFMCAPLSMYPQLCACTPTVNTLVRHQTTSSESVSVDPTSGTLLLLDKHGYLHRADPSDTPPGYTLEGAPPAYVGPGRPLASHMDAAGDLVICDTLKGLTMLDREGRLSVLTNRVGLDSPLQPGTPLRYVNDLDIASDGAVVVGGFLERGVGAAFGGDRHHGAVAAAVLACLLLLYCMSTAAVVETQVYVAIGVYKQPHSRVHTSTILVAHTTHI